MRILYANVIEQNAGWGAECFVNRGFHRLRHATACVDYRARRPQLAEILAGASNHDAFLLQRGDGVPSDLIASVRGPRLFWASELVSRCPDQDPLLRSRLFDHVFFHTRACLDTAVGQGWLARENGSVLLNGFDEEVHHSNGQVVQDIDLLFCACLTPRRQRWIDELQTRFRVHVASAFGDEMVPLIHRSKIVLNVHAEDYRDTETRVFEVLGCGGFLLTERLSPDSPFTAEHLAEFDTFDELCEKATYYLQHDRERRAIAERGHFEALLKHTYTHRAAQIAAIMERLLKEQGREPAYWTVPPTIISGVFRGENSNLEKRNTKQIPNSKDEMVQTVAQASSLLAPDNPDQIARPDVARASGPDCGHTRLEACATSSLPDHTRLEACATSWTVPPDAAAAYLAVCERATSEPGFGSFKRDPAYRRILEHVTEDQGRRYLEAILAANPALEQLFPKFAENDKFGNPVVFRYGAWTFSPTTLRYIKVTADLLELFGGLDGMDIVEIGGGYGGQCKIIADLACFRSYTLVDLPASVRLAEKYLAALRVSNVRCLASDELEPRDYDLAISNFALSELDSAGQKIYLEKVIRRSERGYMTWNNALPDWAAVAPTAQVAPEEPRTGQNNVILTWKSRAPVEQQPDLNHSH